MIRNSTLICVLLFFLFCTSFSQINLIPPLFKAGDLKKALVLIDSLSYLSPDDKDAELWYYKGLVLEKIYSINDTLLLAHLDQHALKASFDAFEKAKNLQSNKIYSDRARKYLDTSLSKKLLKEGLKLCKFKKVDEAVTLLECYTSIKANDTSGLFQLAISAEKGFNYEVAKKSYLKLLSLNFRTSTIYKSLFYIYCNEEKNYDEASKILLKAKNLYPQDLDFNRMEIDLLQSTAKFDRALNKLDSMPLYDPKNSKIYYFDIAVIYTNLDSTDLAIDYYKKCLALDSNYYNGLYNLGGIFYSKAHEIYEKINKMTYDQYLKTGKCLEQNANVFAQAALPYFEKCYSLKKEGDIKFLLIDMYVNLGERNKANKIERGRN